MRHLDGWPAFVGCVLIVAVVYCAQVALVPLSPATLITFVPTPAVTWMQRRTVGGQP